MSKISTHKTLMVLECLNATCMTAAPPPACALYPYTASSCTLATTQYMTYTSLSKNFWSRCEQLAEHAHSRSACVTSVRQRALQVTGMHRQLMPQA